MLPGRDLLARAASDIGYRQDANGSNKFGKWYGMDRVAWCMEAVQYWYAHAGLPLPYKTASCGALLNWYYSHAPECVIPQGKAFPGCIVIFDFPGGALTDHTGLFERFDGNYVVSVDGNTSNGNDANGGCVQRRRRLKTYIRAIIKPRGLLSMTGNEIVQTLAEYLGKLGAPDWSAEELAAAKADKITDGGAPQAFVPRYQAAIMAERAAQAAVKKLTPKLDKLETALSEQERRTAGFIEGMESAVKNRESRLDALENAVRELTARLAEKGGA